MATTDTLLTKGHSKEIPKGDLGIMLVGIVLCSFAGGVSIVLGVWHGTASDLSLPFLVLGCSCVFAAVSLCALILRRANWIPEKRN